MHSRHSTARPRRERRVEESTPTKSPVNGFPVSHMLGHNLNETKLEQTAGQTKLHWTGHRLGISLYEACGCRGGEFGGVHIHVCKLSDFDSPHKAKRCQTAAKVNTQWSDREGTLPL